MLKFILRRILFMIPVMLCVVVVVFSLMYFTPGDPVDTILAGADPTEEVREALREELGLNGTYLERLLRYIGGLLHGDLGLDYNSRMPVIDMIRISFPNTIKIAGTAILFATFLGIAIGVWAAVKQYTFADTFASVLALIGNSMPVFWLALLLMLLFSIRLNWLPATGLNDWKSLIMPAFCTSVGSLAAIARMTRSSMLEVIRSDYITTARAKGVRESKVVTRHALGNAMIPVVTTIGIQFGNLLGGSVLTETVFAIPGMGTMIVSAIKARNLPVVQGGVLVCALALCVLNLLVDLLYGFIDPRIKSQYQ